MKPSGISIVIVTLNAEQWIARLLESFQNTNTFKPVEFIIIDHGSTDQTLEIMAQYATRIFIRLIKRGHNHSFAGSLNFGARKAKFPHLVFLSAGFQFSSNLLHAVLAKLTDPSIGAVGILPKVYSDGYIPHKNIRKGGDINLACDTEKILFCFLPIQHESLHKEQNLARGLFNMVKGGFLSCRKADFINLRGFFEGYDNGYAYIDFCIKLALCMQLKSYCMVDLCLHPADFHDSSSILQSSYSKARRRNENLLKKRIISYIHQIGTKRILDPYPGKSLDRSRSSTLNVSLQTQYSLNAT